MTSMNSIFSPAPFDTGIHQKGRTQQSHPQGLDHRDLKSEDHSTSNTQRIAKHHQKVAKPKHLNEFFDVTAFGQQFQPDSTILLHGDPASAIYRVVSGTVRCCTIGADGGRQIFSFAQKGDYVGISDFETWHFTAEAVDYVILQSVPRSTLEQALAENASLRTDVRTLVRDLLIHREHQLLSLISQKAPERLYGFLQDFAAARSGSGFTVLPMSRRDIGDHLGMTMETACRAFGVLKDRGVIEMATPEKYRLVDQKHLQASWGTPNGVSSTPRTR